MKKQRLRTIGSYMIPSLVTLMIVMGVFIVKGIFPFGGNRIDYYDMGQTNAPLYYHIYDFLHGKVSLFYDWYINEGQNLAMGSAIQWNISPFNLFFLFVPRSLILESLSLFTLLRLVFMSLTMYVFLHHVRKVPYLWEVVFSVGYSLCGYAMTHYTIPTYLDTAVFVPLLMLGLYRLLKEGKAYFYTIMLGFTIALSYYLGFMNLIFILMESGLYLLFVLPKEKRGDRAWKLGIGTIAGLGLSCVTLIPATVQMLGSTRFNSNLSGGLAETLFSILNSIGADMYYMKWWLLYGMALPGIVILFGIWKYRKDWKKNLYWILAVFIPASLIPVESINILWHFGTYYHYPVRCGYLIPFAVLTAAAYYMQRLHEDGEVKARLRPVTAIVGIIFAVVLSAVLLSAYLRHELWQVGDFFPVTVVFFLTMLLCYAIIFFTKGRRFCCLAVFLLLMEWMAGAYVSYGVPHYTTGFDGDPEQSGEYVILANQIKKDLPIEESFLDRIKNPDTELNTNYSMILNRATVTGWANTVGSAQQDAASCFGYGTHFMRILDSGGTFFTDSLLNVKDIVAAAPCDYANGVYTNVAENDKFTLYQNEMSLPFGMTVSSSLRDFDVYTSEPVKIQNAFYKALTQDEKAGNIAEHVKNPRKEKNFAVTADGWKALYMRGGEFDEIRINGETIVIPSISELDQTAYPAWFNSNVVCLGTFRDETIEVEVLGDKMPDLFVLDLTKLQKLSDTYRAYSVQERAGKNSLHFTVPGTAERDMVLLPINYDKGWSVKINGEKTSDVFRVSGLFTGILLKEGENVVDMRYSSPGRNAGLFVTFMISLLVFGCWMLGKRFEGGEWGIPQWILRVSSALVQFVWWIFAVCLYLIPCIWLLVHEVVKRL